MLVVCSVLVFLATLVSAIPLQDGSKSRLQHSYTADSPCAQVSSAVAAQASTSPRVTPQVPAQLAYDCITSVPLNADAALRLMESIRPYLRWQSTTAYLKDPPAEYVEKIQPPVDLWAGFESIIDNLKSERWTQEYEFGWELYRLLQSSHDGHLLYVPDVVGGVFNWGRPVPLVSISEDGHKLPAPFAYADILAISAGNASFTPSPIVRINGEDAIGFLEKMSGIGSLQDRDALYNNLFYEPSAISLSASGSAVGLFAGGGRGRWVYPGAETELTFANGSTNVFSNFARVLEKFDNINSGQALYDAYFSASNPATTVLSPPTTATSTVATGTPAPGFPPPVVRHSRNLVGGYYIDDEQYRDVAVLSVPSFVSTRGAQVEFQAVAEKFLAQSKAAGKKKLIVDLSANGGGTILLGYDLFKLLFPDPKYVPYGATRFRAHEAFNIIGQEFSDAASPYPRGLNLNDSILYVAATTLNYETDVTSGNENFASWEDKLGPNVLGPPSTLDNFTDIIRWNFTDPLTPINSGGITVTGYQTRTEFVQPFAAEDIVILSDGYCASTCTLFTEEMRRQAGIKTFAIGGRPQYADMQAVGGVKGSNTYPWNYIQSLVSQTFGLATEEEQAAYSKTELAGYDSQLPFQRSATGVTPNVNVRDAIRQGDGSQTPTQFVYETADCRLFYTAEMTVDVTAKWKATADAAWGQRRGSGKGGGCVPTSGDRPSLQRRELTREARMRVRVAEDALTDLRESLQVYTNLRAVTLEGDGLMLP